MTAIADILAWMEMERVLELIPPDDPDRARVRRAADALEADYRDLLAAGEVGDELLLLTAAAIERSAALVDRIRGRGLVVTQDTLDVASQSQGSERPTAAADSGAVRLPSALICTWRLVSPWIPLTEAPFRLRSGRSLAVRDHAARDAVPHHSRADTVIAR